MSIPNYSDLFKICRAKVKVNSAKRLQQWDLPLSITKNIYSEFDNFYTVKIWIY